MALESGNHIINLVETNPVGATDDRSTSDDHHRLIKKALKNAFAGHLGSVSLYGSSTGADTKTMTVSAPSTLSYTNGMMVLAVNAATNTTAVTFNLNSLGAKSVTRIDGLLAVGDMPIDTISILMYNSDSDSFILLNPQSGLPGKATEWTTQQNFDMATLTDAASISWNHDTQQVAQVTLGGNRTLANPTNMKAGSTSILLVKQDATGGRTLAYGSAYKWPAGVTPVIGSAADAINLLSFFSDGTNMLGTSLLSFS